ncbi:NAD+ synthase [Algisphaera agarilytica]|uniref:Glutamine-dependent NAD(+) synthetase n=1 Tax=Algisphaera agarilytica TaxID=1385975 RepID=A0A7X0H9L4_9BACT|nr:NAD+ synthase [Algisphaera agarilytica]MBB6430671.1 NAD+ synthase/NAD+ synthase (glutamine-hydrolyzing) [Algisphaera agarilytica]
MKIALAQINPTVGDIAGNALLITRDIRAAREKGAELVVFPELAIIGYPPKDLLLKPAVIEQCVEAIEALSAECVGITAVVGYPCPSDSAEQGRALYNAAAVCADGKIVHRHIKSLLPTYDVFDEHRYFEPGPEVDLTEIDGVKLGISVCEDLWNERDMFSRRLYHDNPIDELAALGAQLFVNCSASPFVVRKHAFRKKLMSHVAKKHGLPLVYCNQVGGNDELVFDGRSCVFDGQGNLIAHGKAFEEDLVVVDLESAAPIERPPLPVLAEAYEALVLGLRDYCRKCGFKRIVLGLSGGIDSAVTAAVAVAALGSENVRGVGMPSRYSSGGSVDDARKLAENLGIQFDVIPIESAHTAVESMLADVFAGREPDVTEENIQARLRGVVLMAMSNKFASLLLTTGNKSEVAVGYCTLYGDMNGGFSVLSDVPKTMVFELAEWMNTDACPLQRELNGEVIPVNTITKPPSAELRPDQKDSDSLPPYDVLDNIIERYVEREHSAKRIIEDTGYDTELVLRIVRLIDLNEYKRKQAAPGLKITSRAFGFGRRMPIAQRYDNRNGVL